MDKDATSFHKHAPQVGHSKLDPNRSINTNNTSLNKRTRA